MILANIINLEKRKDRRESVTKELEREGVPYQFWPGVIMPMAKQGISIAHKNVIRWAKKNNYSLAVIGEDDISFPAPGSWQYFLDNIPQHDDWDLLLSGYYFGKVDENNIIKSFSGLSLYAVNARFFDTFLNVPENKHLDTALSMTGGKFYVTPLMCCVQTDGYSDQRKSYVNDSVRIKNRKLFGHVEV